MLDPTGGTVDHYQSWSTHRHLAYEWSNYRFASHILNSMKRTANDTVLDPYVVQPGWFEIILPSLQLRLTDRVPLAYRAKAAFTLKRLKLGDGEKIVRWRQLYYERYQAGQLTLEGLRELAPLIAEAVERERRAGREPVRAAGPKVKVRPKQMRRHKKRSKERSRAKRPAR